MSDQTSPITEGDIANFLANTPGFFERHAELLAQIELASPHGSRAVSLQERQADMLREKIRQLELKSAEMIRFGQQNEAIVDKMQAWTRSLLMCTQARQLPSVLVSELERCFAVPQAAIKVWGVQPEFLDLPAALDVTDEVRSFAGSLAVPYVGKNADFEAVKWLEHPLAAASVAMIPLRAILPTGASVTTGLLVLASDDPQRFDASMGTDLLSRIGEVAASALARLRG
jgi:uncharacterized protein YigA (DUF484 family)